MSFENELGRQGYNPTADPSLIYSPFGIVVWGLNRLPDRVNEYALESLFDVGVRSTYIGGSETGGFIACLKILGIKRSPLDPIRELESFLGFWYFKNQGNIPEFFIGKLKERYHGILKARRYLAGAADYWKNQGELTAFAATTAVVLFMGASSYDFSNLLTNINHTIIRSAHFLPR